MTYRLEYDGTTVDTYEGTGRGLIGSLIAKADRNPGMKIVAEVWKNEVTHDLVERVVESVRVVYPVVDARAA